MYPRLFTTPGLGDIAEQIDEERQAQEKKWGRQDHPDGTGTPDQQLAAARARDWCQKAAEDGHLTWADIVDEEVREALAEDDPAKLDRELTQIMAVCAAWKQAIYDRHGRDLARPGVAYYRAMSQGWGHHTPVDVGTSATGEEPAATVCREDGEEWPCGPVSAHLATLPAPEPMPAGEPF